MSEELFLIAQRYESIGYVCLPVNVTLDHRGKKRIEAPSNWNGRRFTDPQDWAGYTGLAINTGASGVVGVDIDVSHGKDGFAGLEREGIQLEALETSAVLQTQSGGQHRLFRVGDLPLKDSTGRLAEAVDIKAEGMLVFPPTVTAPGRAYRWLKGHSPVPVADLPVFPEELAQRLVIRQEPRPIPQTGFTPGDVTTAQREWALQKIDYKLSDLTNAGAGERNEWLGRTVPRIMGLAKTIGADLDAVGEKILSAYQESGGDDETQCMDWILSAAAHAAEEDPMQWLPEDQERSFWDSRPELKQIQQAAYAGLASPWAVLGALSVRVLADVPWSYRLDTGIGSPRGGNLNLFAVLAAESGGGKGIATGVAQYLWDTDVLTTEVASGEALPKLYVTRRKQDDGTYSDHWLRRSVIVDVPEFGSVKASGERQGSTLMQRLCSAFSGESLAFAVSDESKNIDVPGNSYRLGVITGVQYANAGLLLSEASVATGQAQRFLWFPANVTPEELPAGRLPWPAPLTQPVIPEYPGRLITVCKAAREELWRSRQDVLTGTADALDGHKLYARVKLAYALAVLNGHLDSVREEDWRLSGIVVAVSDSARDKAQSVMAARERKADRKAGERAGLKKVEEANVVDRLSRQVDVLRRKLTRCPGGVSRKDLRNAMDSRWRHDYFEPALAQLLDGGEAVEREETYRLA